MRNLTLHCPSEHLVTMKGLPRYLVDIPAPACDRRQRLQAKRTRRSLMGMTEAKEPHARGGREASPRDHVRRVQQSGEPYLRAHAAGDHGTGGTGCRGRAPGAISQDGCDIPWRRERNTLRRAWVPRCCRWHHGSDIPRLIRMSLRYPSATMPQYVVRQLSACTFPMPAASPMSAWRIRTIVFREPGQESCHQSTGAGPRQGLTASVVPPRLPLPPGRVGLECAGARRDTPPRT